MPACGGHVMHSCARNLSQEKMRNQLIFVANYGPKLGLFFCFVWLLLFVCQSLGRLYSVKFPAFCLRFVFLPFALCACFLRFPCVAQLSLLMFPAFFYLKLVLYSRASGLFHFLCALQLIHAWLSADVDCFSVFPFFTSIALCPFLVLWPSLATIGWLVVCVMTPFYVFSLDWAQETPCLAFRIWFRK